METVNCPFHPFTGLPDSVSIGETYTLQVLADLTMVGQTNEVSFDVTVTPESETQLAGLASASIQNADWGISVPRSQSVQAVADEVLLELEFSAVKIQANHHTSCPGRLHIPCMDIYTPTYDGDRRFSGGKFLSPNHISPLRKITD